MNTDFCTNPAVLNVIRIILIIIKTIFIIAPIILIIVTMIAFFKAVIAGEDELKKAVSKTIHRVISAVIIFFIPTIVNLFFTFISNNTNSILDCYTNATSEKIEYLATSNAKTLVSNVKNTLDIDDYNEALSAISKIKDKEEQAKLKTELEELKDTIDLNYNVNNLRYEINKLKDYYNENDYNRLNSLVKKLPDGREKQEFTKILEEIKKEEDAKNIQAGEFVKKQGDMSYYVLVPEGSTANMPVIVFLGGDGINNYFKSSDEQTINSLHGLPIVSSSVNGNAYASGKFILVVPQGKGARQSMVQNGKTSYYNGTTWTDGDVPSTVMAIINNVVSEYNADKNKISLTGFSKGAIGVWNYIYNYSNYFSAALPVSCCGLSGSDYQRLTNTDVYAVTGYDHNGAYTSCMNNYVNNINSAGGNSKYYYTNVYDHGSNQGIVFNNPKTYSWLLCNTRGLNRGCAFPN